jgi:hypothetical protein
VQEALQLSIMYLVSIVLGVVIIIEGRHYKNMQVIGVLIIVIRIMDLIRFLVFPDIPFEANIITFFSGLLIFVFALSTIRQVLFKHKVGIYFLLFSIIIFLRFPIFIDVLYMYVQKFSIHTLPLTGYYNGILFFYYISMIPQILAIDGIIKENLETYRYKYQ